ncbi:hypothetical protein [Bacillus atrophaeus]|uniref:hypothetical protein n=1 Tax=Bacillus atrophaeus TaxID=1452 RepID=UPI003BF46CFE
MCSFLSFPHGHRNANERVAIIQEFQEESGIAEHLACLGAKVVVNYASSPDKAETVVNGIREKRR